MSTGNHIADYPDMRDDDQDEFQTCSECNGEGMAIIYYNEDDEPFMGTCPCCKGSGETLVEP